MWRGTWGKVLGDLQVLVCQGKNSCGKERHLGQSVGQPTSARAPRESCGKAMHAKMICMVCKKQGSVCQTWNVQGLEWDREGICDSVAHQGECLNVLSHQMAFLLFHPQTDTTGDMRHAIKHKHRYTHPPRHSILCSHTEQESRVLRLGWALGTELRRSAG